MPDFAGSKTQNPRCRQRPRGFKTKKGTNNSTANPSYALRKFFFPQLLYIVYQIFRRAQIFVGLFLQPREVWRCRQIIGNHNYSFSGKKEAPLTRHFRLQSKNFCLQGLFSSACSIHAFISVASVLKWFLRIVSTSSSLCRPSFR